VRRLVPLLVVAAMLALPAVALGACPRTTLGAVENDVMCLQCGTPLSVSEDAPAAQRERALIEQLVATCRTKKQVEDALVAQYGDRVLALPRAHGFALSAYVVPLVALLAGLALVLVLALRWRRARPARRTTAAAPAGTPSGDAARLEADLDRYRL
jgi:cytochrome c-type biogenesis protein CcmH